MPSLKDRPKDCIVAASNRVEAFCRQHGGTVLKLSADAEHRIREMSAKEGRFSDSSNPLRDGNFRHLLWVVERACWLTRYRDSKTKEILADDIEMAAQTLNQDWSSRVQTREQKSLEPNVTARIATIVEKATCLFEPNREQEPHKFASGDGNLEMDLQLAGSVRDLLKHAGHGLHQRVLLKKPEKALDAPITGGHRWHYVCILGILGASHEKHGRSAYQWELLNGIFGEDSFSRDAMKTQYLPAVLEPYSIKTDWGSKSSSGPAAGFVRLLFGNEAIQPNSELASFGTVKKTVEGPRFFWAESNITAKTEEAALKFFKHLSQIARSLGLSSP